MTTDRQIEALAMVALGLRITDRLNGSSQPFLASISALRNRLVDDGLLSSIRRQRLTREGVKALRDNWNRLDKLAEGSKIEDVVSRIAGALIEIERNLDREEADIAEHRERLKAKARERENERRAAIPVRLRELLEGFGLVLTDDPEEGLSEERFEARLVDLWDAIVNADAGL